MRKHIPIRSQSQVHGESKHGSLLPSSEALQWPTPFPIATLHFPPPQSPRVQLPKGVGKSEQKNKRVAKNKRESTLKKCWSFSPLPPNYPLLWRTCKQEEEGNGDLTGSGRSPPRCLPLFALPQTNSTSGGTPLVVPVNRPITPRPIPHSNSRR